ncbi:MAG: hypothetical protein ACK502_05860 [Alphaproteobacteria bacterium]
MKKLKTAVLSGIIATLVLPISIANAQVPDIMAMSSTNTNDSHDVESEYLISGHGGYVYYHEQGFFPNGLGYYPFIVQRHEHIKTACQKFINDNPGRDLSNTFVRQTYWEFTPMLGVMLSSDPVRSCKTFR